MTFRINSALPKQVAALKQEEQDFVIDSFTGLMGKMVDVFAQHVGKFQTKVTKTVQMTFHDAMKSFQSIREKWRQEQQIANTLPNEKLQGMVDTVVNSFIKEGPLTKDEDEKEASSATSKADPAKTSTGFSTDEEKEEPFDTSDLSSKKGHLEFDRFAEGYESATPLRKEKIEHSWKSFLLNNVVHVFSLVLGGVRVIEKIENYTEEERVMLGEEAVEFISTPQELPCGEYALLKSGEKRLGKHFIETLGMGYAKLLQSWGYKVQDPQKPETNDLLVYKERAHVLRYVGDNKLQSKYGNDNIYCVEEDYDKYLSLHAKDSVLYRRG